MLGHKLAYLWCLVFGHSDELVYERGKEFGSYRWRCSACHHCSPDIHLTPVRKYRRTA